MVPPARIAVVGCWAIWLLGCRSAPGLNVPAAEPLPERGAAPAPVSTPPPVELARGALEARAHPRIFLTREVLERVKQKAAAGDRDWAAVSQRAERYVKMPVARYARGETAPDQIGYAYQGFGWLDAVTALGLAYQVTSGKPYARKIVEILGVANATAAADNLEPISADSGFPSRSAALALALGFDWAYAQLTPGERAATAATLNRWFDWCAGKAVDRDGPPASNYFGGHLLGFGAAGYATLGDNPRAAEIVEKVRAKFERVIRPAFVDGPLAGGYPAEGYVYGTNHYQRLLEYALVVATATGTALPGADDLAERIAGNLLHAIKPNRWQVPDEADYPGDMTGVLSPNLGVLLAHLLAGKPRGAQIQHLLTHLGTPPQGLVMDRSDLNGALYWDARRPATDFAASEPLYLHSAGDEHLFMRSSWAPDAVWASFSGGLAQLTAHQARAAGHLAIQRGNDALLIYAGQWKGRDGVAGHPQQFQSTSAFANTLFINDGGSYLYDGERYRGGQSPFAQTRPFPFAQSADLTWARLDATPAYDRQPGSEDAGARSLRQFVRSLVYLRPGTFVVLDRVQLLRPGYQVDLRFHFGSAQPPRLVGRLATSVNGGSALHIRTLLPRAPAIKVGWNAVDGKPLDPYLAVGAATPGTTLEALHLISAGDRGAAAPDAVLVTAEGETMLGVQIRAQPRAREPDRVVLYAAGAAAVVPATAVVHYRVTAAGPSRHYLFDLAPSHAYQVRAAPVAGLPGAIDLAVAPDGPAAAFRSSEVGALAFEVADGVVRPVP